MGRDPVLGRVHLILGRQNLCFSTITVIYGLPNCVLLSFVGRQLLNVEKHCFIGLVPGGFKDITQICPARKRCLSFASPIVWKLFLLTSEARETFGIFSKGNGKSFFL